MKLTLIAIGHKMPAWVEEAVTTFVKRLNEAHTMTLIEIPLQRRHKEQDLARLMEKEMQLMTAAIPAQARVIALDIEGEMFSSEQLACKLERLQHVTAHLCFLIGGPEGLSNVLRARADERWSLSKLTLPHPLARIVLLEALYRAWSILNHHPYHK